MTTASERREKEMGLWKNWKKTGSQDSMNELVMSYQPVVNQTVSKWRTAPIPDSAIEAMAKKQIVDGIKTYDPKKGTQLNTHLMNYQKGVYRFATQYQNFIRLPEHRVRKVGIYSNTYNYLKDKFDREPTAVELSEELGWDIREVERMGKELARDLIDTGFTDETGGLYGYKSFDDFGKNKEVLEMIYYDLTPDEKLVYEYVYGVGGKKQLETTKEVATKMKLTDDKVRSIKRSIGKKLKYNLDRGY